MVTKIYIEDDEEDLQVLKNTLPDVGQSIPRDIPVLPIIATTSNPIFPKFIRIIEIQDPQLQKLILKNVQLKFPYAGIFVRKDDKIEANVANNASELYNTGTFIHIQGIGKNSFDTRN
jgi:ATP-dependent Lon protease